MHSVSPLFGIRPSPIRIVFPRIRPIAVKVVGEETGLPIAGARVFTLGDSPATGIVSGGTTDAAGKVLLGLPPGRYRGIVSDPPIETRYIRTYQRPLVVEPGEGAQPLEIRQRAGFELGSPDKTPGQAGKNVGPPGFCQGF